ncbi:hypothetical protein NQ152_12015 [Microbacterium sp. zg.B48]|uniref:hypothetical protein n=1 Tax=Microbacterium sp. zg.B48 TaxID=2969408 RepID=UPI00214BA64A|nr:hypothetical protein [Microbacterium sp. zg.B48]MCR2764229.1 hypothetical protein [Microbacterium sp. zg.B48]
MTPVYRGIAQIASLDGVAVDAVEVVAAIGPACKTEAMRSFTNGQYWEAYPDVLASSRYIDLLDPSIVQLPSGPVAAPCIHPHGFRALLSVAGLICDDHAFVLLDETWVRLPTRKVAAIAVAGSDLLVAHAEEGCSGLALTRFIAADSAQPVPEGCAEGVDIHSPVAIASDAVGTLVWSPDSFTVVP